MEGADIAIVDHDQNTETESCNISKEISEAIQVTQDVSEAMKDGNTNKAESVEDIEMADQSDSMDELNLEIQTVESIQEPKACIKLSHVLIRIITNIYLKYNMKVFTTRQDIISVNYISPMASFGPKWITIYAFRNTTRSLKYRFLFMGKK